MAKGRSVWQRFAHLHLEDLVSLVWCRCSRNCVCDSLAVLVVLARGDGQTV